ncbi:hypothetical protein predicted by Glimmer/Critica [Streptococcus dysgalactiae subsp. equisimilis AC-2713]|uniref:Uncharacterized protein n=1 Tax=Streptococcus dysgalactiae subsp. equisimilis AC-2713 TaxID=759913 RepID=A0AB33R506_STREQ|nr:hypothetical protein predicted by Glimmer/Critica [Streptococcus dysgalactiae subsp. equisimilis AC-2713]
MPRLKKGKDIFLSSLVAVVLFVHKNWMVASSFFLSKNFLT